MATNIYDKLRRGVATTSAADTQSLAAELAEALPPDMTLALHGNLGAGKTTFVQGLARGLGVTAPVTSPTFSIYSIYPGRFGLVHLDAYRLETEREIDDLLLEDFLTPPFCLAVEWPEKIAAWIPAGALHLDLGITADRQHTLRLR
jgi:tRNA threonylcarbamoyladenosine biosynthesis protein TsaE